MRVRSLLFAALSSGILLSGAQMSLAQGSPPTPAGTTLAPAPPTSSAPRSADPSAQSPASTAAASTASASAPAVTTPATAPAEASPSACRDDWPQDRERPKLTESFPLRGISGHVAWLEINVTHLPGEYVFPAGVESLHVGAESEEEMDLLRAASFTFVDDKSELKASLERKESNGSASTKVRIPLIPLPKEAGRFELTLPPLPVAISRSSGQVHTLCTAPHVITVEDPLASTADAAPRPDPQGRSQIEVWTSLRDTVFVLLWALPLAILIAWLLYHYRDRFKRVPAPPPPIPPWVRAREQLREIEVSGLLSGGEFENYLDRVSDTLREYLGARYGFDGLESTTRELLRQVSYQALALSDEQEVRTILQRADLVKFARRIPSQEECEDAMRMTVRIIDHTTPAPVLDPRASGAPLKEEPKAKGPTSHGGFHA